MPRISSRNFCSYLLGIKGYFFWTFKYTRRSHALVTADLVTYYSLFSFIDCFTGPRHVCCLLCHSHTHKLYRIFYLFYLSYILFLTGVTVTVSNDNGSLFFSLLVLIRGCYMNIKSTFHNEQCLLTRTKNVRLSWDIFYIQKTKVFFKDYL